MTVGEEVVEQTPPVDDYLDDIIEDQPLVFSTSDVALYIPQKKLHPMGRSIAIFVLCISVLGAANGADFVDPNSGLVRADEFVYRLALTAPPESAQFDGVIYDDTGQPFEGMLIHVSWEEKGGGINSTEMVTNQSGEFHFENLTPGLLIVDMYVERDGYKDWYTNRILLSPPAIIEPIGFTKIDFTMPSQDEFQESPCKNGESNCTVRIIDMTPTQMEHPIMDPSAASAYVLIGFGFIGLALIAAGFAIWALFSHSIGVLRMSTLFAFFTMGHYYSACILGLVAFLLTFAIPKDGDPVYLEHGSRTSMDLT
jgi:hypothetical protein